MSRILVLFFAVLLPLQFAWSAAAAYCQHETNAAQATHFGHHVHVHKADAKKAADTKFAADTDCGACHATGLSYIASDSPSADVPAATMRVASALPAPMTSALARAPDRPQWLRLV